MHPLERTNILSNDSFSKEEVIRACQKLSNKSPTGADQIPSYLIRGCCEPLEKATKKICNLCLKTKTFSKVWKLSKVCPIHKCDSGSDVVNYRPISYK